MSFASHISTTVWTTINQLNKIIMSAITIVIFIISIIIYGTSGKGLEYKRGLTDHFISWLNETGYEPYGFNRTHFFGGSFGGRENDSTPIKRRPVVFIHGG